MKKFRFVLFGFLLIIPVRVFSEVETEASLTGLDSYIKKREEFIKIKLDKIEKLIKLILIPGRYNSLF